MSIFRTFALAVTLSLPLAACSQAGTDTAEPTSGPASGAYLNDVSFGPEAGVSRGAANAAVTIIEYASITCSHCKQFHDEVIKAGIYNDYVGTGKVRLIFREYPLNQIDVAGFAIARCAGEAQYFDVLDDFFDNQADIIEAAQAGTILDKLNETGARYGLDSTEVDACIQNPDTRRMIAASAEAGQVDGVTATPTIYVNGSKQETRESRTLAGFSAILDEALGQGDEAASAETTNQD